MGIVKISGIRCFAFHGCLEEEAVIGGNFMVDIEIETDFSQAASNDELSGTVDYVEVYEIVKKEMATRSKLIENVAKRISDSLLQKISNIEAVEIKVTKINPPVNGEVEKVTVEIKSRR